MGIPVTEDLTVNREMNHPAMEIVDFTTQSTSDYYISRKFGIVDAAFASNKTADGEHISVSWATLANGNVKVTITPIREVTKGHLLIIGRK